MKYLFDVDGTLTPSRGTIDPVFKNYFLQFCKIYSVSLVTGSDLEKTLEQLGEDILDSVEYSFNCCGNAVYKKRQLIYKSDWIMPDEAWQYLENYLYQKSSYKHRYGKHFEQRIGMLNFSVVGRNAVGPQRTEYFEWDNINLEREYLANQINQRWTDLQAVIGGETGIDIFKKGCDKSQVLKYFNDQITFFGDRTDPAGNDYPLSKAIVDNTCGWYYNVKNWNHTWTLLKQLCPNVLDLPANGLTDLIK